MRTVTALLLLAFVFVSSAEAQDIDQHVSVDVQTIVSRVVKKDVRVIREVRRDFGDLMIERDFTVSEGELLFVDVSDADLIVETHDREEALVEVYLKARNMRRAEDYFERLDFDVSDDRDGIRITTDKPRFNISFGNESGGATITVIARIPATFDLDVSTSDGDITVDPITGDVSLKSSDGDILTSIIEGEEIALQTSDGDIDGRNLAAEDIFIKTSDGDISLEDAAAKVIDIQTSDGDISAGTLEGETEARTSDGDITIDYITGPHIALRTSDGDIQTDEMEAETIEAGTSDGDLDLGSVSGELRASTSSGEIAVILTRSAETYLKSGDGNITITLDSNFSADLYLKGERVRFDSDIDFHGRVRKNEADGRIASGGPTLEARSSDGTVALRIR